MLPLTDRGDDRAGGLVALRLYGADGGLRGIAALAREGRLVGAPQRLLREGRGRSSITVAAEVRRVLASTPLQLDRFEERTCVTVHTRIPGSGGRTSFCHEPGPARPQLEVLPEHGCGRVRSVLWGFVGDGVGAVRLRLGSGRVLEVRTRTLRGAGGAELRVVATPLPWGEAIRSVAAVGAPERYEIGEQPGGLPCVSHNGVYAFGYPPGLGDPGPALAPGSGEQAAAERDGHRLLVRDAESERLCAGIDRLLADGTDCLLPPATAGDAVAFGGDGLVSGIVPAEVARVRLANGRELETVEGGYDGRYRGTVRFLLRGGTGAFAAVGCSPRVAVVYGVLAREARSVTAQLRDGRRLRARIVPIPRRLGRGRAFVLALPRGAQVDAMRFDGRRFTFPLLPAADQCGYRVYEPYLSPPVEFRD